MSTDPRTSPQPAADDDRHAPVGTDAVGRPKVCQDRLPPGRTIQPYSIESVEGRTQAIMPKGKAWPTGSVLTVKFLGGTPAQQELAMTQARWWTQTANLSFEQVTEGDADIRVTFDETDGAWSYVGTDNREIPQEEPTMNLGFMDGGTAGHEFGHAIGMSHEHQNPRGGIEWNEAEVIRDLSGPPNNWDEEQIRHNVLRKYSADQVNGTRFDPESIMLYAFPASWTLNGIGTKANEELSETDRAFVASDVAYPGRTDGDGAEVGEGDGAGDGAGGRDGEEVRDGGGAGSTC